MTLTLLPLYQDFQDDNEARLQEFEKVCRDLSDRGLSDDAVELEKVEHELMEASSKREKALESAMEASRKFHAHLGNVLSWIDDMEEKVEEKNPEVFKVQDIIVILRVHISFILNFRSLLATLNAA